MRALIVSDIHGNLEAFQSVLADAAENGGFGQIWCLGDLVGYGPDPSACIDLLRQHDARAVAGNHDLAAIGAISGDGFTGDALEAVRWTTLQLSFEQYCYLLDLPLRIEMEGFTMVHGSPRDPCTEYLVSPEAAVANFPLFDTSTCLVGHSHIPLMSYPDNGGAAFKKLRPGETVELGTRRLIINPGGLGQPRDRDSRAPYAIYDSAGSMLSPYRVEYDIARTQTKMAERGLPRYLRERLAHGL